MNTPAIAKVLTWKSLSLVLGVPSALLCILSYFVDGALLRTVLQAPFALVLAFELWTVYVLWSFTRAMVRHLDALARFAGLPDAARKQFLKGTRREIKQALRRKLDAAIASAGRRELVP